MNFYHALLLLVEYVIFMHTDAQKTLLDFLIGQYNSKTCIVVAIFSQMLEWDAWEINALSLCCSDCGQNLHCLVFLHHLWWNTVRADGCQHKLQSWHRWQRQINRDICTNAILCSYEETQNCDRCSICQIELFVVWQPGIYLSLLNNKKRLNKKKVAFKRRSKIPNYHSNNKLQCWSVSL